jgi:uncharacterized protein (TIGR00251 family)
MSNLAVEEVNGGVVFTAKVVPGSSRTAICGLLDEMVKIKVSAAPERGKANKCLLAFLAKRFGVKSNAVRIISGETNPIKRVQVSGVSAETVLTKLNFTERNFA